MDPIIFILRILVPLSIFRFPLLGALASLWVDGMDWNTNFFNLPNLHLYYSQLDKLLDIYYLIIEAFVVLRWRDTLVRNIGLGLFFYRAIGVFLFVITEMSPLLVLFPNIFEGYFIFYLSCSLLLRRKNIHLSKTLAILSVITLTIPKVFQEYWMHVTNPFNWRYIHLRLFTVNFQLDTMAFQIGIIAGTILVVSGIIKRQER